MDFTLFEFDASTATDIEQPDDPHPVDEISMKSTNNQVHKCH